MYHNQNRESLKLSRNILQDKIMEKIIAQLFLFLSLINESPYEIYSIIISYALLILDYSCRFIVYYCLLLTLLVTSRQFSSIFVNIRHFSSLLATSHHFSSLLVTSRHFSSRLVTSIHFDFPNIPTTKNTFQWKILSFSRNLPFLRYVFHCFDGLSSQPCDQ